MAGFRPGLGRGGITHSLVVTEPGRPGLGDMADTGFIGIAGAKFGAEPPGEPADDGVDTLEAIFFVLFRLLLCCTHEIAVLDTR
jgi:hypothetical protein